MPDGQDILLKLEKTIDTAIEKFNGSIPGIQKDIFNDVITLVKQLDTRPDGTIKQTVSNLRLISRIKSQIEKIILSDQYVKNVKEFIETFKEVGKLQNEYFRTIEKGFKTTPLLKEIQLQSINATIDGLTEAGIGVNVTNVIENLLRTNVTTGGSYAQLQEQLRNSILTNKTGSGLLERYVKQVTTDSIMQFNRTYSAVISDDLGMVWYLYTGSNIDTTREFCRELTKKKYIHKSEIPTIVKGIIDGKEVRINEKSGLWAGAIPGTNTSNFQIYCGGFNCQHRLDPVLKNIVPAAIRAKFED